MEENGSLNRLRGLISLPLEVNPVSGEYRIEDTEVNEQYAVASLATGSGKIRFFGDGVGDNGTHTSLYELDEIKYIREGSIAHVEVGTVDGSVYIHRKSDCGERRGLTENSISYTRPSLDNITDVMLNVFTDKAPEFFYTDVVRGKAMCDMSIVGIDKVQEIGDAKHSVATSLILELNRGAFETITKRNGEEKRIQFNPTQTNVEAVISRWATQNERNRFLESIRRIEWDGVDRVGTVLRDIGGHCPYREDPAVEADYLSRSMWAFVLGTLQKHLDDGCGPIPVVLVLQGGQGTGKSAFCRALGRIQGEDFYQLTMQSVQDTRRFLESVKGAVIVELSEATQFSEGAENYMKAIVDAPSLQFRDAYARDETTHRIYYSMIATTNDMTLLSLDSSGNRRFFPVVIQSRDAVMHSWALDEYYINQLWAQAFQAYHDGQRYGDYLYSDADTKILDPIFVQAQGCASDPDGDFDAIQAYLDNTHPDIGAIAKTHLISEHLSENYPSMNADKVRASIKQFRKHPEAYGFEFVKQSSYRDGLAVKTTYVYARVRQPLMMWRD